MNRKWNWMLYDNQKDSVEPDYTLSANLGLWGIKAALDYLNSGATLTRPPANPWVALCTGSPTAATPFGPGEPTGSGYTRQQMTWCTTLGFASATNISAMTFGPFTGAGTFSGIGVLDISGAPTNGNIIWAGILATARPVQSGDSLTLAAGNLTSQVS